MNNENIENPNLPVPVRPTKPKSLRSLVRDFLEKRPIIRELIQPNTEELKEKELLIGQVINKVFADIMSDGFTIFRDISARPGERAPSGPREFTVAHRWVGLKRAGKNLGAEMRSSRLVGGLVTDSLELTINDKQYAQTTPPSRSSEVPVRTFTISRRKDYTEDVKRRHEELKSEQLPDPINLYYTAADKVREEAITAAEEKTSLTVHGSGRNSRFLTISEQLQFLREILDAQVDEDFTQELARDGEQRLGEVQWNRDNPGNIHGVKKLS